MFAIHEKGVPRTRRVAGYILAALPSLGVLISGITKFFPGTDIHLLLQALGMDDYAIPIGLIEIIVVVLYWIPRTSKLGFFLFCTYIGGILVAEIMLGDVPVPALAIGGMVYLGTFLLKPSLVW
ncbi:hypothetical protein [Lewinella sp. IMCC34191]|uniref:hypothetical protein n=1 Tax=Lewinella sp. IMCC34191 TaxID=2259172 RepID=UPI000E2424A9|nr:hypothetical protein [Lewinella sp. IMCC34191]